MEIVLKHLQPGILIETVVYMAIGIVIFGIAIWLMEKITPFSIRKEIEEDQNVALGIVMGSVILGMAIILAAVLRS